MKNNVKFLEVITILAVIGFVFSACGDGGDDGGNGGNGGNTGRCYFHNWDWENYTSGSGLRQCQKPGCTVTAGFGDTGQAGGKIIYADANKITEYNANYLEVSSEDQAEDISWCNCPNAFPCDVTGATGTAIGSGRANTEAIIAHTAHKDNTTANNAAKAAVAYTGGGKTDWFLPSKDELNFYFIAIYYNENFWWYSSQISEERAWAGRFHYENRIREFKYASNNVRAIRAF